MRRASRWALWTTLGITLVELAGAIALIAVRGPSPEFTAPAVATVAFVLASAMVGTLIGLRRPGHRIGWLLRVAALCFATGALIVTYVEVAVFERPGELPVGPVLVILGDWAFSLGLGISATFLLLLFPTGRLPSPRWRPVAWLSGISLVSMLGGIAVGAFTGLPMDNPLALESSHPVLLLLEGGGFDVLLAMILASVASLVVRYRRAVGDERQQLKWVALGVSVLGLALVGTAVWEVANGPAELSDNTENFVTGACLTMIPVTIGVAILRYRLYDIDRIISRTVSYGMLTAVLAAAYGGLVFILRDMLPLEGGIAVASSTLAVAALFNPLRRRVQSFVDRRFNRSRFDQTRTIEAFAHRLGTVVDLGELERDLRDVAAASMQPTTVSLWLRG